MLLTEALEKMKEMKFQFVIITPESSDGPEPMKVDTKTFEKWASAYQSEIVLQEEKSNVLIGNNVKVYTLTGGWISKKAICVFFGQK
jgi:hypothetical protein